MNYQILLLDLVSLKQAIRSNSIRRPSAPSELPGPRRLSGFSRLGGTLLLEPVVRGSEMHFHRVQTGNNLHRYHLIRYWYFYTGDTGGM